MGKHAFAPLALVVALGTPPGVCAQMVEVPTFPVGQPTFASLLQDVDVAPGPDDSFLVVWGDYQVGKLSGSGDHATLRRFSSTGIPLAPAVRIDTSAHVFDPHLSPDGRGGFAAAWLWISDPLYLFFGQYLDATGRPTGRDFEISLNLEQRQMDNGPVVGTADGPIFFWGEHGIWMRRLDDAQHRRGGDARIGENLYKADVDTLADGGFVLVWHEFFGIAPSMARVFDARGNPRTPPFAVNQDFELPRVAASPRGGFTVVGIRGVNVTSGVGVWARRFADDGTPLGPDFEVDAGVPGRLVAPDAVYDERGNLLVVWGMFEGTTAFPLQGRAYDVDGVPLGPAVVLGAGPAWEPRAVRLTGGGLATVWYWDSEASGAILRICPSGGAVCGDGVRTAACEECDDGAGNGNAADACRADCQRPRCGDGVLDSGEGCDDGNVSRCDGCSAECLVETGVACGDGVMNASCHEECDDGAGNGNLVDGCRADCRAAYCGDGVVDTDEECDDGNAAACDGCGPDCRGEPTPPAVCAPPLYEDASAADVARFLHGRDEFLRVEQVATGLGPVFNGRRCAECHSTPTIGGSSDRNVTRVGAGSGTAYDPLIAVGGPLVQVNGTTNGSCSVAGEVVPAEATAVGQRNTPPLYGLGLVEAIPDASIRRQRDRQRAPISGRLNVNTVNGLVGRFGWKAQITTIHDFAAEAYRDEMGITSPFALDDPEPQGVPSNCDTAQDPEDPGDDVAAFTDFIALLAPLPTERRVPEARRGRSYFRRLKCHGCHVDKYRTSRTFPIPFLRGVRVPLYSDLLVHDMGPALADGIEQERASGSEFRTAPLWGVAFSAPYLHDGRAATLAEAILAHGGEAQTSRDAFVALPPERRAALVAFLNSL